MAVCSGSIYLSATCVTEIAESTNLRRGPHTFVYVVYYSCLCPVGRIVSNGAHPVYSPMFAFWPIGRMVEVGYPLTGEFSQGPRFHVLVPPLHANDGYLGLVREQQ